MLLKLAIRYIERKGFTAVKQAEGMTTIGFDIYGNKYSFYRK
jgi:hypothetical protein